MIQRIINTPMELLRFQDFKNLKCGHDSFSKHKIEKLKSEISLFDFESIEKEFSEKENQARAIRWMLRGLSVDKAIRKVKTDLEVTANVISNRGSNKESEPDHGYLEMGDGHYVNF